MKLHAQVVYLWKPCVLLKIGDVWSCCCCCWFFHEFMIIWCCCYEMLFLWIHAMGIHNYEDCEENWIVLESFMKNEFLRIWVNCSWEFWFKFYIDLSPFLCLETVGQTLRINLGVGNQISGFWGKNGVFPRVERVTSVTPRLASGSRARGE